MRRAIRGPAPVRADQPCQLILLNLRLVLGTLLSIDPRPLLSAFRFPLSAFRFHHLLSSKGSMNIRNRQTYRFSTAMFP